MCGGGGWGWAFFSFSPANAFGNDTASMSVAVVAVVLFCFCCCCFLIILLNSREKGREYKPNNHLVTERHTATISAVISVAVKVILADRDKHPSFRTSQETWCFAQYNLTVNESELALWREISPLGVNLSKVISIPPRVCWLSVVPCALSRLNSISPKVPVGVDQ